MPDALLIQGQGRARHDDVGGRDEALERRAAIRGGDVERKAPLTRVQELVIGAGLDARLEREKRPQAARWVAAWVFDPYDVVPLLGKKPRCVEGR